MASKFATAMKAKSAAWKKARGAAPRKGSSFGPVDIPNGQYEAAITAEVGVLEKGKAAGKCFFRILATVTDGEHKGKEPQAFYILDGQAPRKNSTGEDMPTNEEKLAGDLKNILPDVDVDNLEADQLEGCAQKINQSNLVMKVGVRTTVMEKGAKKGQKFQDVYFNEIISSGESVAAEGGEDTGQEEETSEEGGEEEEGEEEGGEEEGEVVAPGVGDPVMYKPKGARAAREFTVKTVNNGKQTVTLSDGKKKFSDIPWSALE